MAVAALPGPPGVALSGAERELAYALARLLVADVRRAAGLRTNSTDAVAAAPADAKGVVRGAIHATTPAPRLASTRPPAGSEAHRHIRRRGALHAPRP
jgi:hypothetical protein